MGADMSKARVPDLSVILSKVPEALHDHKRGTIMVKVYTDFQIHYLEDVDPAITILDLKKKLAHVVPNATQQSVVYPANVVPSLTEVEAVRFYSHAEVIVPDSATLASCGFADRARVKVLGLAASREAATLVPQEPMSDDLVTDIKVATRNFCVFHVRCPEPAATTVAQLKGIIAQRLGFFAGAKACVLEYTRPKQTTVLLDDRATLESYDIKSGGATIVLAGQPANRPGGGRR